MIDMGEHVAHFYQDKSEYENLSGSICAHNYQYISQNI
jgi:hypothetical protein